MIKLNAIMSYHSHVKCLQSHTSHADLEQTSAIQEQEASTQDTATMSYIALCTCSASCLPGKMSTTKGMSAIQPCLPWHACKAEAHLRPEPLDTHPYVGIQPATLCNLILCQLPHLLLCRLRGFIGRGSMRNAGL